VKDICEVCTSTIISFQIDLATPLELDIPNLDAFITLFPQKKRKRVVRQINIVILFVNLSTYR